MEDWSSLTMDGMWRQPRGEHGSGTGRMLVPLKNHSSSGTQRRHVVAHHSGFGSK